MKKISVIIPVYNGGKYLRETVESIQNQTYPIYEVIIVNDGSTDDTQEVINSLKNEFSNIVSLIHENSGPAKARNYGIKKSVGEYIAFCDADDTWIKDKIEKQLEIFDTKNVGLVFSGMEFFGSKEGEFLPNGKNSPRSLFWENSIPNSSVVIHRSVIDTVGLFNGSRKFFGVEDYQFWLRTVSRFPFYGISEPLLRYRVHEHQISNNRIVSYKKLVSLYWYFLIRKIYIKYWHICFLKIIQNIFQYFYYSVFYYGRK